MTNPNLKKITVETYNDSAQALAEYFRGIGSRIDDIELAIKLSSTERPDVLEIGCGDGRDAKEIISRVKSYVGFDISKELIKLAQLYVSQGNFIVSDALEFEYGTNKFDIVFAFASLLHLDKEEIRKVAEKVHTCLKKNGILLVSLKMADEYKKELKIDKFGKRLFYFYNPKEIIELTRDLFIVEREDSGFITVGNTEWFEMVLVKK